MSGPGPGSTVLTATPAAFDGPLSIANPASLVALREVLDRHGFTSPAAMEALGPPLRFGTGHLRDDVPFYLHRLAESTPLNTLIRLFVLGCTEDQELAAAAFAPLDLDEVIEIGLIESGPDGIRAPLRLSMYDDLLVAHDSFQEKRDLRPDHVLDVNPTTITLSKLTVRRPVARALEIGTGCGALALCASRHADRVVATDTNPRALNMAVFNAAMNRITNVEWRLGSLFDTVAGEAFDLIFTNPPYVVSPDSHLIFRDGGRRGDAFCEEIVRRVPEFLNDGGFATVLLNWVVRANEEWAAPLKRWVDRNGCDSWLMLSATQDPETCGALWTRERDSIAYTAALDRWVRYLRDIGAERIGQGAVVLRKRATGSGWVRADHLPENVEGPAGSHIERLFAAEDRLAALSTDDALLDSVFTAAPDHELQQRSKINNGRYVISDAKVALLGGLPFHGSVDKFATQLISRCDGRRTLRAIAEEIATEGGVSVPKFTAACTGIARRLIAMGFLV
jgi:Methyltransferase small domain